MSQCIYVNICYTGKFGMVSDFGNSLELLDSTNGRRVGFIPRYGVWKLTESKRKHEVVLTTSNLEEAMECANNATSTTDERRQRLWDHGGEECYRCGREDYEQNMVTYEGQLYCEDCAPNKPAEFEDVAKALQAIHPEAEVVATGGGIDCIRILVGHHALYFGTGGENWGASVYTILSDGREEWIEEGDHRMREYGNYDPNINLELSSDEPDAAKVAAAINAATDAFYSKHYVTHKPAGGAQ